MVEGWDQQQKVRYEAGALLLDPDDPSRVLARSAARFVFYGMADTHIGVARLERV